MSELQVIESSLKRAARRRRWVRVWGGLWRGLLVGGLVWLAALALYKVLPLPITLLPAAGAVAGGIVIVFLIAAGWRKSSLLDTARWVDNQQHLKERLSTALEFSSRPASEEWRQLVVQDAAAHANEINPRQLAPLRLPRISRWALLVLALGVGFGFVPEYRSKEFQQKQREAEVIKETGRQLADLTKRDLQQRPPMLEPTQKALEQVKELGEQLQQAKLTRSEALQDIANVTEKLKDQLKEMGNEPAMRRLERAARSNAGEPPQSASDLQKQIDAMQKSLGEQAGNPRAMESMKNEMAKLQQAAAGLKDKDPAAAQAAREQMSQALADLAQKAAEMGLELPNLDDAIKALEAGQIDQFLKDMDLAQMDLEKMAQMAKAIEQLKMQLAEIGKDLAEQLEKGQAFAAVATLKKMMRELESANLSPEQMEKMLEEVRKATGPGSEYGDVGKFLEQAAKEMKAGQKSEASQSLANAAKELEKMMEQMGDGQSLMAALENLGIAQMCVGTCQGWGQCSKPGLGEGGKPGSGVGTWADDANWAYTGPQTDLWDNSGVVRPDMDARGLSDRGEGEVSDALKPTRVKGQMSPGGQMPSITLKGVSITGESKVAYEEAVTAAQVEAQSALSQDQVPRAYQGAVREYFDDFKP